MGDMPSLMPCEGLKIVAHSPLLTFFVHIFWKGCCVKLVRHAGTGEQNLTFTYLHRLCLHWSANISTNCIIRYRLSLKSSVKIWKENVPSMFQQQILRDRLACHKSSWVGEASVSLERGAYKGELCPQLHCYITLCLYYTTQYLHHISLYTNYIICILCSLHCNRAHLFCERGA